MPKKDVAPDSGSPDAVDSQSAVGTTFTLEETKRVAVKWKHEYQVDMPPGEWTVVENDSSQPPVDAFRKEIQEKAYRKYFAEAPETKPEEESQQ